MKRFPMVIALVLWIASTLAFPASASADATTGGIPEPAGIGLRLVDIPTNALDDPRARSYIVDHVKPGSTIERRIEVQNHSGTDQAVRIYPGAARVENGTFTGEEDPSRNELTDWISLESNQVELSAGESKMVMVTIDVPTDAPQAELYGAVWAEVRGEKAEDTNVIQASRVGIRIYLSVGAGNGRPADFDIGTLTAARDASGRPQVRAEVTNTGGRAVDITGELKLEEGPGGLSAGPLALERATTIIPGNRGVVIFPLANELPNGPWDANLYLRSGSVEESATAELVFPEAGEQFTAQPESGVSWLPIAAAGIILLLLIALYIWRARRRRTAQTSASH